MRNKTLFFQFFTIQIILIFASIFVSAFLSTRTLVQMINDKTAKEQETICNLIVNMLPEKGFVSLYNAQDFAFRASAGTRIRLTLIQYSGSVLADSHSDPSVMENHFNRPEVQDALRGFIGKSVRYSTTMNEEMYYIAIPVPTRNLIVRTSISVEDIKRQVKFIYIRLAISTFIILFFATIFAYLIAKNTSGLINSIKNVAEHYASGDFSISLEEGGNLELQNLGKSINIMGKQLKDKINTITSQRNELQAMLNSMTEPVILLDENMNVREINPSAVDVIDSEKVVSSRKLNSILKNTQILKIVKNGIKTRKYQEEIVCLNEEDQLYYLVHVSFIEKLGEEKNAALLVMNDISGIKRLEKMRKEFVANVSHELKTPVTSIIGYVETLLAGKVSDKKDFRNFLSVINRQAVRLEKIIEDLLTLSKVDDELVKLTKEVIPVTDLIGSSASACSYIAEQKNMSIIIDCDDELELFAHPILAEQAVSNLIDNAVKYGYPDTVINVKAEAVDNNVIITVADSGPGISKKNIDRIFDRFYRVDKSRSRDLGGTGLGLAIVKHIARTHGGKIEVESEVGIGTTFRLYFSNEKL
ncbi:MAG: GHKL domain-containing protein [Spirochaetales bacterium]|nr:GHKL domain-containing protein [Spirochaetales bacterium]